MRGWRWATAADLPDAGFHAAFADNRNQIPPTYPPDKLEFQRYPYYAPPGTGGSCTNGGSRNTDVLTSRVTAANAFCEGMFSDKLPSANA